MNKKIISILLLVLFIILLLLIINRKKYIYIESFDSKKDDDENSDEESLNKWTTDRKTLEEKTQKLNNVQKKEVKNMINAISQSKLETLIANQSPLLVGPSGPPGIQGPPGTTLIASGRLINKSGSFDKTGQNTNYFMPKYVVTRTEGTSPASSLSFMDNTSAFASFQNWQLDINNHRKNRYDDNCLTMSPTQDKLYIDKCNDNPNQKWTWDKSNRIISTSASTDRVLKCISLSNPEQNVLTTNIPGCSGAECKNDNPKRYLTVKDCDINNINENEIWSFV